MLDKDYGDKVVYIDISEDKHICTNKIRIYIPKSARLHNNRLNSNCRERIIESEIPNLMFYNLKNQVL